MERHEQRGWWGRNWKWAVPSGCLMVVVLAFAGCAALIGGAFSMMRNTAAFEQAMDRVQSHPGAVAALGEPIEAGWAMTGDFKDNGATGEANYAIPVSGPKGAGTLFVEARKRNGTWEFQLLNLVPDDGSAMINLLGADEAPAADVMLPPADEAGGDAPAWDEAPADESGTDEADGADASDDGYRNNNSADSARL